VLPIYTISRIDQVSQWINAEEINFFIHPKQWNIASEATQGGNSIEIKTDKPNTTQRYSASTNHSRSAYMPKSNEKQNRSQTKKGARKKIPVARNLGLKPRLACQSCRMV
jgi:hypothetical protein